MKKSNLWAGLLFLALGLCVLISSILWVDGTFGSLLCGVGGTARSAVSETLMIDGRIIMASTTIAASRYSVARS